MKFETRSKDYKSRASTAARARRTARETLRESGWLSERAARVPAFLISSLALVDEYQASGVDGELEHRDHLAEVPRV
jgi:hypothetical protein